MYRKVTYFIILLLPLCGNETRAELKSEVRIIRHGISFSLLDKKITDPHERRSLGLDDGVLCYVGTYEVTQKQWGDITQEEFPKYLQRKSHEVGGHPPLVLGDVLPAYYLDFADAKNFITKLNELELNVTEAEEWKFFIPSEEQWVVAARSGIESEYQSGDILMPRQAVFSYETTAKNSNDLPPDWFEQARELKSPVSICEVGTRSKPNASGLYDIHGNISELTSSLSNDAKTIYPELRGVDVRIRKGGNWKSSMSACSYSSSGWSSYEFSREETGLRVFALVKKNPRAKQ